MRWRITPAFGYGARPPRLERRGGDPGRHRRPARAGASAPGTPARRRSTTQAIFGRFEAREGSSALIALCAAHQEPLVFPTRDDVEARLEATTRRTGATGRRSRAYAGPWRDAVIRSALALKLLVPRPLGRDRGGGDAPPCPRRSAASATGTTASAGCATPPSRSRRCCSSAARARPRRSSGGCCTPPSSPTRASRSSTASTAASARPSGRSTLRRLPRLAPGPRRQRRRRRRPSSTSTATCCRPRWSTRRPADGSTARPAGASPAIADLVCRIWRQPDSGIWEVRSEPAALHPVQDDVLGRARPRRCAWPTRATCPRATRRRGGARRTAIREFIETRCWSDRLRSYTREAGSEELDASLLLGVLLGYDARTPAGCARRSTPYGASSGAVRCSPATAERTGCAAARAPSSAARSGSPTRSPGSGAATRPRR